MHRNGMVVIPADIVRQMGLKKGSFVLCFFHVE
ncbi:AbrB/MazE/SpoVT family DNA-binding domain-containing protein, partial [Thermoplasma sp.]